MYLCDFKSILVMKNLNVENLSETLMPIINEKVNLNNKMLNFFFEDVF